MQSSIAYISRGRLYLKLSGQPTREIESKFANGVVARHQKNAELDGWKSQGVWGNGGMGLPDFGQFQKAQAPAGPHIQFLDVCRGPEPGHIYYVVQMDSVVGVFQYVIEEDREIRLLHKDNFFLQNLSRHQAHDLYAMSIWNTRGTCQVSTSEERIRPTHVVSGGENMDQAPRWSLDGSKRLVYQSAPIGKDENGYPVGLGSFAIDLLDLETGKVETLIENDDLDFLSPKLAKEDTLFFIERPYKIDSGPKPSMLSTLQDILYFPYRLARAVFYFFNFISMTFSGKSLANTLDMNQMPNRQRFIQLWGHALDTQKAIGTKSKKADRAIAPKEWILKKRKNDGTETRLADHVLCYDVDADGNLAYSDGTSVFSIRDGNLEKIDSGNVIQTIALIDA